MTKIAGALNMLPQTFLREGISNTSAKEAIEIYKADGDYPKFYRNFVGNSDNGRSSSRLANTFSLNHNILKTTGKRRKRTSYNS
jgi:hypothetical protein